MQTLIQIEPLIFGFTTSQILTILIGAGAPAFMWWLKRDKQKAEVEQLRHEMTKNKAETEQIAVKTANEVLQMKNEENKGLLERVEANERRLRAAIQANDDCEFEHGITRLQLNKALKKLDIVHWVKSSVFVLDDNKMVTDVFIHRFRTIPVVAFKAFTDPDGFLEAVQKERPEVVVVDHELSNGRTAKDVINHFGYTPEILIMSGTKENEQYYKGTDIRFYYKDAFYIKNITRAILDHLITKNQ